MEDERTPLEVAVDDHMAAWADLARALGQALKPLGDAFERVLPPAQAGEHDEQ